MSLDIFCHSSTIKTSQAILRPFLTPFCKVLSVIISKSQPSE
nr:MAG TPA: hypothetical protein [Caudoviricetes sp.]